MLALTATARAGRLAEQLADRAPGAPAGEIPEREVDRRERLRQLVGRAAGVEQRAARPARAPASDVAVGVAAPSSTRSIETPS